MVLPPLPVPSQPLVPVPVYNPFIIYPMDNFFGRIRPEPFYTANKFRNIDNALAILSKPVVY